MKEKKRWERAEETAEEVQQSSAMQQEIQDNTVKQISFFKTGERKVLWWYFKSWHSAA